MRVQLKCGLHMQFSLCYIWPCLTVLGQPATQPRVRFIKARWALWHLRSCLAYRTFANTVPVMVKVAQIRPKCIHYLGLTLDTEKNATTARLELFQPHYFKEQSKSINMEVHAAASNLWFAAAWMGRRSAEQTFKIKRRLVTVRALAGCEYSEWRGIKARQSNTQLARRHFLYHTCTHTQTHTHS